MIASARTTFLKKVRLALVPQKPRHAGISTVSVVWLLCMGSLGTDLALQILPVPAQRAAAQPADDQSAPDQPADPAAAETGGEFIVTWHDPQADAERINIPLNRQIVIDTSQPFARVEALGAEIVRLEPISTTRLLVTGQKVGVTQVVIWTAEGDQHVFEFSVELDLELLNRTITDLDPQSEARAISVLGHIILLGTVSGADIAQQIEGIATIFTSGLAQAETKVRNLLKISGEQQVHIKCIIAEVSRTAVRKLGINGFLAGENFRDTFLINQIGGINPINIQAVEGIDVRAPIPFITGDIPVSREANLILGFPRAQLQLFMRAMSDNQLSRILAEPTLVAISGETASFLVGGEFPVPVPQGGSASGAITIEYKKFGVNLMFTPLVLPNQRIRMTVIPEISARDEARGVITGSGFVPAVSTRRVETTVEMESGATIAIAGLLQDEVRGVASAVPGIGNVPILGALFRSVDYLRSRTELVILVTPELVAPMTPEQIPELPGVRVLDPTDLELFLLGVLEGAEPVEEVEIPLNGETDVELEAWRRKWRSDPNRLALHGPWGPAESAEASGTLTAAQP